MPNWAPPLPMQTRRKFVQSMTGAAILALSQPALSWSRFFHHDSGEGNSDARLLDELQRASFDYFWSEADPESGLVRDRANANGGDSRRMSSIAATGFGLTALCIAHRRNYLPADLIVSRARQTLRFLAHDAPHVQGFLYHYTDLRDGSRYDGSEISPIDMAILLCGVLTCREYFDDEQIRRDATEVYERVEWPWALNGGNTLPLSWTPEFGFTQLRWDSFSEGIMLYLLAIGSPTHPISPACWHAVGRPLLVYQQYRFVSAPAPLFVHQFPQAWFDLRGKRDEYLNYFDNSVAAVRAHRQFCLDLKPQFASYSENLWGITASDSSKGYVAWGGPPLQGPVDGTIVPAAAAGSLPFLYRESIAVLHNLRHQYGEQVWKRYGFVDAFNPITGWVDRDVVGIDAGISMIMAENSRSQFVWETFMQCREAQRAMQKCGFHSRFHL